MALFRPILGELSGSIGNNTWAHNKGGAYSRRRAVPTNPTTLPQQNIRQFLVQNSRAWAALSTVQRAEWADWAATHPFPNPLGDPRNLSGQQAFCMCNTRNLQNGVSVITSCPTTNGPAPLTTAAVVWTAPDQIVITFTPTPLVAGTLVQVWGTLPGSAGKDPNFRQARLLGITAVADTSPATVTSRITAIAGQVSNLYLVVCDSSGQNTPAAKLRTIVA